MWLLISIEERSQKEHCVTHWCKLLGLVVIQQSIPESSYIVANAIDNGLTCEIVMTIPLPSEQFVKLFFFYKVNILFYPKNFPSFLLMVTVFFVVFTWIWTACIWNSHPRQRHCYLSVSGRPNCGPGISFGCISSCFFNCRIPLFVLSLPRKIRSSRCHV